MTSGSRFEGIVKGPKEHLGKEHPERRNRKCKDPEAGGGRRGWSGVMEWMGSRGWVRQLKEVRTHGAWWATTETAVLQELQEGSDWRRDRVCLGF